MLLWRTENLYYKCTKGNQPTNYYWKRQLVVYLWYWNRYLYGPTGTHNHIYLSWVALIIIRLERRWVGGWSQCCGCSLLWWRVLFFFWSLWPGIHARPHLITGTHSYNSKIKELHNCDKRPPLKRSVGYMYLLDWIEMAGWLDGQKKARNKTRNLV